jgi:hypothetical protein
VLAKSNDDADILSATRYVVDHGLADVISQSFGEAEECMDPAILRAQHQVFQRATAKGITLVASSGDDGAAQPSCDGESLIKAASTPAGDPLVTGVGGTRLDADLETGAYHSETAWSDEFGASGGGFSKVFPHPALPAAAALAEPGRAGRGLQRRRVRRRPGRLRGRHRRGHRPRQLLHRRRHQRRRAPVVGPDRPHRPAGPPPGRLPQRRHLRHRHEPLYGATFHDITTGDNSVDDITGFQARRGWDAVAGWGTPKAVTLVPLLALRAG